MTPPGEGFTDFAARWGFGEDSPLLRRALTHRSAAPVTGSNERLEFLGDALLETFVSRYVYDHLPLATPEDALSRARVAIVRRETLAQAARSLGLGDLLIVGPGEKKAQRERGDKLLADAFEAVSAALYLERGQDALDAFLREVLADSLAAITAAPPDADPKTLLQVRLQGLGRGTPTYETQAETDPTGPAPFFSAQARDAAGVVVGEGRGATKRAAQTEAARAALASLS